MLPNTLNTNEVKGSAGTEVEFTRISTVGRTTEYKAILETPGYPLRLKISHQETGTGSSRRRRSLIRFDKTGIGQIDVNKTTSMSAQLVLDIPLGNLSDYTQPKDVLAYLMSFVASLGASTTILYDCTGNGAVTLINGDL